MDVLVPFPPTRIILATVFALFLVACGSGADEANETARPDGASGAIAETVEKGTRAPGEALTPRPGVVADLETARRYETEGDIEGAAEAYVAIAASGGPEAGEATLAAARLLIESGDYTDARTLLERFVEQADGTPQRLTATYLLGRAYNNLEMYPEALERFDAYIEGGGIAAPYAY